MTDATLPPLIEQMLRPEFYPHPVQEPIQLVQTHVSFVLLTGEFAYKVKKPVNFGFLDYSTLEKRQQFCEAELRLNQRGAAELYLSVEPITDQEGQFHLRGTGPVVEYALKMRQFPAGSLLSEQFASGALQPAVMDELARVVADYHQASAVNDRIRSYGTVERIREAYDENYAQTAKYIGVPQTQAQYEATQAYSDRFFAERPNLFVERVKADKVRECHGDLHLNNICVWQGQVRLFDCIEFNEPFRFVDTMYDVAFLVMDLDARGASAWGNRFLNRYLEETGDWEGVQVLPLYLSRQAYVRAKVSSFMLDDPAIPAAAKEKAGQQAADYYHLAYRYTLPQQGRLLVMSGLSGSGKSTVASALAERLNAIHMRSDAVRKHLAGIGLRQKGGPEVYTPEMTERTYTRLLDLGLLLAQQGWTVILDAKYDRQALRQTATQAAQNAKIPLNWVVCEAPVDVLRQRLGQRQGDIADAGPDLLAQQIAEAQPLTPPEQAQATPIQTDQPLEPQLDAVIAALS
jgi:aminoglycoside phosphotransferase family enzyme/predicted kinase